MLPLDRAHTMRQEADVVLKLIGLDKILPSYAKVYPTGSYFLDVMVYPDLDLYITKVTIPQLFEIGAQIARNEIVFQVVFERTDDPQNLPGGLYLKPRLRYGDWGRPWKIDIWSLEEKLILNKMAEMQHFQDKMTPWLREQIICYKLSILTKENRTPMYSGYYVYKAFIDEGLTDFSSISQYLISNGIQMNPADQGKSA